MTTFNAGSLTQMLKNESQARFSDQGVDESGTTIRDHVDQSQLESSGVGLSLSTSIFGSRSGFGYLSGAMGSQRYASLMKKITEFCNSPHIEKGKAIHVLPMDKSHFPSIHFSCIIIGLQARKNPAAGIAYQTLVIDGTNLPVGDIEVTSGDGAITERISRFAEAVVNKGLAEFSLRRVTTAGIEGVNRLNAFAVPPAVVTDSVDHENENQVMAVLANALRACEVYLSRNADDGKHLDDLNLAVQISAFVNQGTSNGMPSKGQQSTELYIQHQPSPSVIQPDEFGNLSRTSYKSRLTLGKQTGGRRNFDPNSPNANQLVLEVGTYTDLLQLSPMNPSAAALAYGGMNTGVMKPLLPVVVVSTIQSNMLMTPGAVELALVVANDQCRSNHWTQDFRHRGNTTEMGQVDFNNFGALLVNVPDPMNPQCYKPTVDASNPSFTDATMLMIIDEVIRPTPYLAVDVPFTAASGWYLQPFHVMANGGQDGGVSKKKYWEMLNKLTNNKFDEVCRNNEGNIVRPEVFQFTPLYMETGYYSPRQGVFLPIECLDNRVAVCSYAVAQRNPEIVDNYARTFDANAGSQVARVRRRREIIIEMSQGTAKFTHGKVRCVFTNELRSKINQAITLSGVVFNSDDRLDIALGGSTGYLRSAVNTPISGLTSGLQMQQQQFGGDYIF